MFQIPRPAASTPKLAGLGGFLPQLTRLQASQLAPKRGRGERAVAPIVMSGQIVSMSSSSPMLCMLGLILP